MSTRVHIGTHKKAGNIPILSRCVGTTPTHLYCPIGINNDPIIHGVLATSSRRPRDVLAAQDDSSSAPASLHKFYVGGIPSRQERVLSNHEKII